MSEAMSRWRGLRRAARRARRRGDISRAESLYRRAARELRLLAPKSLSTARLYEEVGQFLDEQGRNAAKLPMLRRAAILRNRARPQHIDTIRLLMRYAQCLATDGQYRRAFAVLSRAQAAVNRSEIEFDLIPVLLDTMATCAGHLSELIGARRCLRQMLQSVRSSDPDLAIHVRLNLGRWYRGRGEFPQAEREFLRALNAAEQFYGRDPPRLVSALNFVGWFYAEWNRLDDAEALFFRAIRLGRKFSADDRRHLAHGLDYLARIRLLQLRPAEAEPYLNEALAIRRSLHPAGHPDIADTLQALGNAALFAGDLAEARQRFTLALDMYERTLGTGHRFLGNTLIGLAMVATREGRFSDSDALLARCGNLPVAAKNSQIGIVRFHQAINAMYQNRFTDAGTLLGEVRASKPPRWTPDYYRQVSALYGLAGVCRDAGRLQDAEMLLLWSVEITTDVFGPDDARLKPLLTALAGLAYRTGGFGEAERRVQRAIQLCLRAGEEESEEIAALYHLYGELLNRTGWGDGNEFRAKAAAIRKSLGLRITQ